MGQEVAGAVLRQQMSRVLASPLRWMLKRQIPALMYLPGKMLLLKPSELAQQPLAVLALRQEPQAARTPDAGLRRHLLEPKKTQSAEPWRAVVVSRSRALPSWNPRLAGWKPQAARQPARPADDSQSPVHSVPAQQYWRPAVAEEQCVVVLEEPVEQLEPVW